MFFEDILRTLVTGESPCYTDRVKKYRARSVEQGDFSVERIMSEKKTKPAALMPRYSYFAVIFAFLFNTLVYTGSRWIAGKWPHHNIETAADRMIPFFAPSAAVYLGCYLFWAVNYILIARQEKEEVCRFFAGDFISRVVCFVFFLAFPTTNVRPELPPDGFWNQVMLWVYSVDAADNLFPSIHCLVSWFCYIGIRDREEIPVWYRRFSFVMALLVCVSTLTTKQHVLVDVAGGILLAELCFRIGKRPEVSGAYRKILDKVNDRMYRYVRK